MSDPNRDVGLLFDCTGPHKTAAFTWIKYRACSKTSSHHGTDRGPIAALSGPVMDEELRASQSPLLLPGKLGESFAKPANVLCRVFALRSLPTRCHAAEPIWHFCTGRLFFKEALITQWCQAPAHNKLHPEGRPLNKQMCTCERASKQTTCNIMVPENRNDHEQQQERREAFGSKQF